MRQGRTCRCRQGILRQLQVTPLQRQCKVNYSHLSRLSELLAIYNRIAAQAHLTLKISSGKKHVLTHATLISRLLHLVVIRAAFAILDFSETLAQSRHHSASILCEAQDLGRPH